jgi:perosamine synthetase
MGCLYDPAKTMTTIMDYIPVNIPSLDGNERRYLMECIESGWISSEGPFVAEFENRFAARMGRKHGISVCNGTAAIDAAVEALDIGDGDEVIMPAFTIISCINQIVRSGAKPVLVDSDPITWNMDVTQIESKLTERTKAIMVVHIYGMPVDMDSVIDIADRYGLKVIEDAAEMHGQTYNGKPCGSFGDISTFSFYPNKHITTGEGGMILTDDDGLAETCRSLRNLCFQTDRRFVHERLGWNMRMTNLQAALGLAQLERLDSFIERKRQIGSLYSDLFDGVSGIQLPITMNHYAENIYWVYGIMMDESISISRDEAMKVLNTMGVGTRPFFCPMHLQPVFRKKGMFKGESHPVSERMYDRGFYLPSGLGITDSEIREVVTRFKKMLN